MTSRRRFLQAGVLGVACACAGAGWAFAQTAPEGAAPTPSPTGKWICPPCGCDADGKEFDAPGVCPAGSCGMMLIPKPAAQEPRPLHETRPPVPSAVTIAAPPAPAAARP